jgi:hypothetical protein
MYLSEAKGTNEEGRGEAGPPKFCCAGGYGEMGSV